jgi:polyisoprenoid-binding protein YceI
VPITLAAGVASGSVAIKRLDFKIGDGEWADTSMVANDVTVKFKLAFAGL